MKFLITLEQGEDGYNCGMSSLARLHYSGQDS
jgi:hypothetical protein